MSTRHKITVAERRIRSAVTNGRRLIEGLDARSAPARRYRDLQSAMAADLGGLDYLTEAQLQLVRSAAGLVMLRERLDSKALNGEPIHTATYCRICNSLRRVLSTVGLKRVAKDITPTLAQYLDAKAEAEEEVAE